MGLMDRLAKIAVGLGGAAQAPFGMVKDLATAPFRDEDDYDGFVHTIWTRSMARQGQVLENLIGPDEGLGAAIGGLPENPGDLPTGMAPGLGVIRPGGRALEPVERGLEWLYREGIAEPTATASLLGAQAPKPLRYAPGFIGGAFTAATDPGAIGDAYKRAQETSPGQAFALSMSGIDINNETEVAAFVGTDTYQVMSGTYDAMFRMVADPTVIGGKVAAASKVRFLNRPIRSAKDIEDAITAARTAKFKERVQTHGRDGGIMNEAQVRDQFFPNHDHGPVISSILVDAAKTGTFDEALRALMGDLDQLTKIQTKSQAVANRIARLEGLEDQTRRLVDAGFDVGREQERVKLLSAEVDELFPEARKLEQMEGAFQSIRQVPKVSVADDIRTAYTRTKFYQRSPWMAPLRVTLAMRPHRLVNLHDETSDIQVARMLSKSDLDIETQDVFRSGYMRAATPGERQTALLRAEEAAVQSIADKAGMTVDEIDTVLAVANSQRQRAATVLKSRVYDSKGRSKYTFENEAGVMEEVHLPLLVSQEANVLPMVDLDEVRKATTTIGQHRARHPGTRIPPDMLRMFYRLWKPAVLLRVAWPIRVVGDEQLRIFAKIGALTQMRNLHRRGVDFHTDVLRGIPKGQRGLRELEIEGHKVQGAMGVPGEGPNIHKNLVSSNAAFRQFFDRDEAMIRSTARDLAGEWKSYAPDEAGYGGAFEHVLNQQFGQDAMARKFLAGESVEDVTKWLKGVREGQAYSNRLKFRKRHRERWARTVSEVVEDYTAGNPELKQLALEGRVTTKDLERLIPDAAARPTVHGEMVAQALGTSPTLRLLQKMVDQGMDKLGRAPTDVLSRNPFFDHMYQVEMQRRLKLMDEQAAARGTQVSDDMLRQAEKGSRQYALTETRKLLYDLAEESELAHILRHFVPFYNAWQEVITRWAGLAVENPAFVARARLIWNSPEKAGIVYDEDGSQVHADGTATNAAGKRVKAGEERFMRLPMPEWVNDFPGVETRSGGVALSKTSFNLALQGLPGFGPTVQIPVNEILKDRPDLEDSLKFVMPFGPSQSTASLMMPASVRRLVSRTKGEDDTIYGNTLMRIYFDSLIDYNLGKRDDKPTYAEAKRRTNEFFNVRTAASFLSPAAPMFFSPYQPYIDAYRVMAAEDPATAPQRFLDTYGEEFFPLTQSLSESIDHVPPTAEAFEARGKYKDLVEAHPDLGGVIIGSEGAGEFSYAVYQHQRQAALREGSAETQRKTLSFEEAAPRPDVSLGWIKYRKAMDLLDSIRVERGLPNMQVAAASDLAAAKRKIIDDLAEEFPEWHTEFSVVDRTSFDKKLLGLKEIAEHPDLSKRPEFAGLREYFSARDKILEALSQRKAKTLTAVSNQDLAQLWEAVKAKIVERNLAFSDLYYRHLEFDPVRPISERVSV